MLKKRILASSMASVMALTSISAVAFADDAFDPNAQQSVTKEQLKTYLASDDIKSIIDSSAEQYGTISGKNFLRACAFAQKVIDGEYDTYSDVFSTVAFQMVRTERAKLVQYTNVQLNDLVKTYANTYKTENHLNELTNDLIYAADKWEAFTDKYEEAQTMENATDIRVTTDVYEELVAAYSNLKPLETKTKAQTEAAKKAYDLAIKNEYKYQPWARGTVSGTGKDYDGKEYSWGALFSHVNSGLDHVYEMYDKFNKNEYKGVTITSNPDIVQAVNDMELGAKVLNSFTSSFDAGSTDTKAGTILRRYHGQLVYAYNQRAASTINLDTSSGVGDIDYKDQAVEMLDELAEKLKKTTKGDTVQVFTKATKTAEPSWILFKDVKDKNGDNAYQYGFWNITSASLSYDPLGSGTSHTEADKILSAELKARIDGNVGKVIYAIETVEKNVSGQGTYVYVNNTDRTAAGCTDDDTGYFFVGTDSNAVKADAEKAIAKLPDPSKYKAVQVNASRTMTLSDYVAVDSTDILDVEAGSGTVGKDYRNAKVADEKAVYELKVALDALKAECSAQSITLTEATATAAASVTNETVTGKVYKSVEIGGTRYYANAAGQPIKADGTAIPDGTATNAVAITTTTAPSANAVELLAAYSGKYDAVYGTLSGTRSGGTKATLNTKYSDYVEACDEQVYKKTHAEANNVADGIYGTGTWVSNTDNYAGNAGKKNLGLSDNFNWVSFGDAATVSGIGATNSITYKRDADGSIVPIAPSIVYATFLYDQYAAKVTGTTYTRDIGPAAASSDDGVCFIRAIDAITDVTTVKGNSTPEWKLICNYMQYAMSDKFDGKTGALKTRKDVQELLDQSYNLVEKTVDTSLFSFSNMKLVKERENANGWDKNCDLLRKDYKDNVSTPDYVDTPTLADTAYGNLNGKYSQLKKEYDAFQYSYKDIANDISRIAKQVDVSDPNNKALIDAIADVADKMVKVDVVYITNPDGNADELADSKALTEDGDFKYNNRNYTVDGTTALQTAEGLFSTVKASKGGDNWTHYDLRVAYNNMLELVKRKKGDVNNDQKINAADAVLVLQHAAGIKELTDEQKSYADMNNDNLFNAADAAEILKLAAK